MVLTDVSSLTAMRCGGVPVSLGPRSLHRHGHVLTLPCESRDLRDNDDDLQDCAQCPTDEVSSNTKTDPELPALAARPDDTLHERFRDLVLHRAFILSVRDAVANVSESGLKPPASSTNKNWFSVGYFVNKQLS